MTEKHDIAEHMEKHTFTEVIVDCDHGPRKASTTFLHSKATLDKDGHNDCWICGETEGLEDHHFGCEWSLENEVDFGLLKAILLIFDFYGYSAKMKDQPITTVDDIRNMLRLCKKHHTGKGTGIHCLTFVIWIMQKICKPGHNPVPQPGETEQQVLERHLVICQDNI